MLLDDRDAVLAAYAGRRERVDAGAADEVEDDRASEPGRVLASPLGVEVDAGLPLDGQRLDVPELRQRGQQPRLDHVGRRRLAP